MSNGTESPQEPVVAWSPVGNPFDALGMYNPDSRHSYFRDLVAVQIEETRRQAERAGKPAPSNIHLPGVGGPAEARDRLEAHGRDQLRIMERERRDVQAAGNPFVPTTRAPSFIAKAFAAAARNAAVLTSVFGVRPLPPAGTKVRTARLSTGSLTAVQATEAATLSTQDPSPADVESPIATVGGYVELTQQAFDRDEGGALDLAIAHDLGRALGEDLDGQVLNGTGASGQALGLTAVVGITELVYTSATPTAAESFAQIGRAAAEVANTFGGLATHVLLHPRRYSFVASKLGYAPEWPVLPTQVPSIRTTITVNQDEMFAIVADEIPLYLDRPQIEVAFAPGFSNGRVQIRAFQYISLLAGRYPSAIARVSGTGLAAPTW